MYEITVIQDFAAAHRLINYEGQCSNIHGHTWRIEVSVTGPRLDDLDMLMDFRDLKMILNAVLDQYDHRFLNEVDPFDKINPTAENLARVIYEQLQIRCSQHNIANVKVWESPNCCASYSEE